MGLVLLAAVGAGLGLADGPEPSAPSATPSPTETTGAGTRAAEGRVVVVERVIDGDTVVVSGGERVRLIGIDTPETGQDECYSTEATRFLRSLTPTGSTLRLVIDVEPLDRFGRTLAYLYRVGDGLFVNAEMVARGYAQTLTIPPNVEHADELARLAAEAREQGAGLWSECRGGDNAGGSVEPSLEPVAIIGVEFDAPGNDNDNKNGEWVMIENRGEAPADLTGWRLEDRGANHYRFPAGFALDSGAQVTVRTGCGGDSGSELHWCKTGSAVWNNSGDTASLFDAAGRLVDRHDG